MRDGETLDDRFEGLNACDQARARHLNEDIRHERRPAGGDGLCLVTARAEAPNTKALLELTLAVETAGEGYVAEAGFAGGSTVDERSVLEAFCRILPGTTILDAREYGAVRLEAYLRGASPRPAPGIVLISNTDTIFDAAEKLIRQAFDLYCRETGAKFGQNFFAPKPSEVWCEMTPETRAAALQESIDRFIAQLEEGVEIRVLDVFKDVKAVLRYADGVPARVKGPQLLALEQWVRHDVDPTVELYLEEAVDQNVIRHRK